MFGFKIGSSHPTNTQNVGNTQNAGTTQNTGHNHKAEDTLKPKNIFVEAAQDLFLNAVETGGNVVKGVLGAVTGVVFDSQVPITGFHPHTAKVDTQVAAAYLLNEGPPLSSLATNVNRQDGVTWYDITPGIGPKFAWKGEAVDTFKLQNGEEVTIVKMKIGDDQNTGASSAYDGYSYVVFGKGWVAEHWSEVKSKDSVAEFLAETGHNAIVDGFLLLRNGFRGLASHAKENAANYSSEKIDDVFSKYKHLEGTPDLIQFLSDPKATGMSDEMRAHVLKELSGTKVFDLMAGG